MKILSNYLGAILASLHLILIFFVYFKSSFEVSKMYANKISRVQKFVVTNRGKVFYLVTVFLCAPNIPVVTVLVIVLVILASVFTANLFGAIYLVIFTYVKFNLMLSISLLVIKGIYPSLHTGVCVNLGRALSPITSVSKTKKLILKVNRIIRKG